MTIHLEEFGFDVLENFLQNITVVENIRDQQHVPKVPALPSENFIQ